MILTANGESTVLGARSVTVLRAGVATIYRAGEQLPGRIIAPDTAPMAPLR